MGLSCTATPSEAVVQIRDHGGGIPLEFLPFVFERFRQADGSRTRTFGGLGLGLALVKSFITSHGGTIQAESAGIGKGSLFTITLPRETSSIVVAAKKRAGEGSTDESRLRVLLVEDEPDTLEMLTAHFQRRGFETFGCETAAEALAAADRESFDIMISDIAMPEIDGLQLIRMLRQKDGLRTTPAIALTGYASQKDVTEALEAGFNLHLPKPIDPAELLQAVDRLIVARGQQDS